MADGRMLKKKISIDVDVSELDNPWFIILFTWGIAHLDIEGRITGNPREYKGLVAPLLDKINKDVVLTFFQKAGEIGLIDRYEVDGKWIVQFPGFKKNQTLRPEKEAVSSYPDPPEKDYSGITPGPLPDYSRTTPDEVKRSKEKRSKEKKRETPLPQDFQISDRVRKWAAGKGLDHLEQHLECFKLRALAKGYKYIDWDAAFENAILQDWAKIGRSPPIALAEKEEQDRHIQEIKNRRLPTEEEVQAIQEVFKKFKEERK